MRPEEEFHIAVAAYLRHALPPDIPWTTIAHGAYLGDGMKTFKTGKKIPIRVLRAQKFKRLGVENGWPDILIFKPAPPFLIRVIGLELKSKWGVLSDDQKRVHAQIRVAGGMVYVPRTLDEIEGHLRAEGILLRVKISA